MSIRRHTVYNILGSAMPLVVSLVTVPLYLELIGATRYGVLAIVWMLLGYFGLFDLGLGKATAQRIAALRNAPVAARARAFWTALFTNTLLGVVGGAMLWALAGFALGDVFKVEGSVRAEVASAIPWLALAVPVATLSGVLSGALQGRELFLQLNVISGLSSVLFQVVPLAAALLWTIDLAVLLPVALFARLFTLLALYAVCRRHVFCYVGATFSRTEAVLLVRFGKWVTLSSLIGPLMVVMDRFVIGAMLGAKAVTYYTVPFQLAERSGMIPFALSTALFPRLVGAGSAEEGRLVCDGLRSTVSVMTPVMAAAILLIGPFLSWWITPAFAAHAAIVGQLLLVGFWINSMAMIPYFLLQAKGRPDLIAFGHLLELLPYLGLLYLGIERYGIAGAAGAFSVRIAADFIFLSYFAGTWARSLKVLALPALLVLVASVIAVRFPPESQYWLVLTVSSLLLTSAWAWRAAPLQLRVLLFEPLAWLMRLRSAR